MPWRLIRSFGYARAPERRVRCLHEIVRLGRIRPHASIWLYDAAMSTTTDAARSASPEVKQALHKRAAWLRYSWALPLLVLIAFIGIKEAQDRIEESRDREPLRVAYRAAQAAGVSVGVVAPEVAEEWSAGSGPREKEIVALTQPGNEYLEPILLSLRGSINGRTQVDRCYYLAVQPGDDFNPDQVEGLVELCYLDPYLTPQSARYTSVPGR